MRAPSDVGNSGLAYRAELDGLRGIAIASVVAYHLGGRLAPGGFVGVDLFFVLSGFLITQLIASDLQLERFSFLGFYERRIRRIVPALLFVCACCTAIALIIFLPGELKDYCSSLLATLISASNLWFFGHSGYFDRAAETHPLLHTWSLGVEEQFYILFPVLLRGLFRLAGKWIGGGIWLLFALSLGASIIALPQHPQSTFFLLHTRAWELLTGSIVALGLVPQPISRVHREVGGLIGLSAIALAIFAFNSQTPFPGAAALLPCVGAGLIIWSGSGDSLVSRALSCKPLVFLGLISYSLYLWHWPLIVFVRAIAAAPLDSYQQSGLAALSLVLAAGTWRYVETPFRRRGRDGFSSRTVFWSGGIGGAALAALAGSIFLVNGLPARFPREVQRIAAATADRSPLRKTCHFHGTFADTFDQTCVLGAGVPPKIIVYGDSHGAELSAALGRLAKSRNASIRQITSSACPPVLGYSSSFRPLCAQYNAAIVKSLAAVPPSTIILAANALGWPVETSDIHWAGLRATIAALKKAGHRVIIYGPVPAEPNRLRLPELLGRWVALGKDPNDYVFDPGMERLHKIESNMADVAAGEHAIYVPVSPAICSQKGCKAYLDATVLYFDNNHPSLSGAKLLASKLLVPILWPETPLPMAGRQDTIQVR